MPRGLASDWLLSNVSPACTPGTSIFYRITVAVCWPACPYRSSAEGQAGFFYFLEYLRQDGGNFFPIQFQSLPGGLIHRHDHFAGILCQAQATSNAIGNVNQVRQRICRCRGRTVMLGHGGMQRYRKAPGVSQQATNDGMVQAKNIALGND